MNYAKLDSKDSVNGLGFGVSLFVSGCRGYCRGCFNQEAWDFNYGDKFTDLVLEKIIELCKRSYVDFFSILGGDPLEPENKETVLHIVEEVRKACPNIKINIWTRFLYEDLVKDGVANKILSLCDELVDGEFVLEKKSLSLIHRGSSNQRIIDLNESRKQNCLVLYDELMNIK